MHAKADGIAVGTGDRPADALHFDPRVEPRGGQGHGRVEADVREEAVVARRDEQRDLLGVAEDIDHAAFECDPLAEVRARFEAREVRPARRRPGRGADHAGVRLEDVRREFARPGAAGDFDQLPGGGAKGRVGLHDQDAGRSILHVEPDAVEHGIGDDAGELHRMR